MTVMFCGVFYQDGSLTAVSALGVFLLTMMGGLGLAAVFCAYLTRKYGAFWASRAADGPS